MNDDISAPERHELKARSVDIPLALFKDKRIAPAEKFLVVIIDMLDNGPHHCYASNNYLGDLLDMSGHTVSNMLTRLRRSGWVRDVEQTQEQGRHLTTPLRDHRKQLEALRFIKIDEELPHQNRDVPSPNSVSFPHQFRDDSLTKIGDIIDSEDLKLRKRLKEEEERKLLQIFKEAFPEFTPSAYQQDLIFQTVTDSDLWRECVNYWAGNSYQPRSISKLLEMYTRRAAEKANPAPPTLSPHAVYTKDPCPVCSAGMPERCQMGGKEGNCRW